MWKRTHPTKPGLYLMYEDSEIVGPAAVIEVWPLTANYRDPLYGWQIPPPGHETLLAKRMHDEDAIEANGMIGHYWVEATTGEPIDLMRLAAEHALPRTKPKKKRATKKKPVEEKEVAE